MSRTGRAAAEFVLADDERDQLVRWSGGSSPRLAMRARIQSRVPDALIRRLVCILVVAIGARYLWDGLS
jgi:hypothetical protein